MPDILKKIKLRLSNASIPELFNRVFSYSRYRLIAAFACTAGFRPPLPPVSDTAVASFKLPALHAPPDHETVQKIIKGARFTLNFPDHLIRDFENRWKNKCVISVPYCDNDIDIRAVWEAGRLQNITLACIFVLSDEKNPETDKYREWIKKELFAWLDDNPFLHGPHYQSAMECGLRIIAFVHAVKVLWGHLEHKKRNRLTAAIYNHAWLVSRRLSLYSSLGNHTISECVGLVTAGLFFKDSKVGKHWITLAHNLLVQEASHQIFDDGGPVEQSTNYHRFVLELLWWVSEICRLNGYDDPGKSLVSRIAKGDTFLKTLEANLGEIPSVGDSDDGHAVAPGMDIRLSDSQPVGLDPEHPVCTFKQTGISLMRCDIEAVLSIDHGMLGMPPLYNHGHADALSINLSVKGRLIIADPGTYRYNGVPEWRKYFKSTPAHSTVTVDNQDQAVQETGFIWGHPFTARLVEKSCKDGTLLLKAEHDGYQRIEKPLQHKRTVTTDQQGHIVIRDIFQGDGHHSFSLRYHLHPDCVISKEENWLRISRQDAVICMTVKNGNENFQVLSGSNEPICGWYSKAYGLKEPAITLVLTRRGTPADVEFLTFISTGEQCPDMAIFKKIINKLQ